MFFGRTVLITFILLKCGPLRINTIPVLVDDIANGFVQDP